MFKARERQKAFHVKKNRMKTLRQTLTPMSITMQWVGPLRGYRSGWSDLRSRKGGRRASQFRKPPMPLTERDLSYLPLIEMANFCAQLTYHSAVFSGIPEAIAAP